MQESKPYLSDGSLETHVHDERELMLTGLRKALLSRNRLPCLFLDVLGICYHSCMHSILIRAVKSI